MAAQNPDWNQHQESSQLIDDLIVGTKDFPEEMYTVIKGFWRLGANASQDRLVRLYTSLDLNEYVEFSFGVIKKIEQYEDSKGPNVPPKSKLLTPVIVWLNRNANVSHARRLPDERVIREEDFLAGDIADIYLSASTQDMPLHANQARPGLNSIFQPCSYGGCGSNASPCVTRAGSIGCPANS